MVGAEVWGSPNEGAALSGQAMSANLASVSTTAEVKVGWGREAWGQQPWNENTNFQTVIPTGISMTATLGDETAAGEINVK